MGCRPGFRQIRSWLIAVTRDAKDDGLLGRDPTLIRKVPAPAPESIKTVLEQLSLTDPKARTAQPDTFIDRSVTSDLEREGFFQRLWR